MKTNTYFFSIVLLCALTFVMSGGSASRAWAEPKTLFGESTPLGQGTARSFVMLDDQGKPVSIGIALTKTALSGLPQGPMPSELTLALPEKVAVPPFDHISVDWNPQGHEPAGIYDVSHFDFHFYFIPSTEQDKISENDMAQFAKAPSAEYLPTDYKPIPGGVPRMGAHWFDPMSPEFQGKPFTATFIYGTYDGRVIFYEPMIASAVLETKQNFSSEIKQPTAFQKSGYYPKTYRSVYDETTGEYRISLDELTSH
ncbi:hypothetical protein U27_03286 [Candidatus Vecturithrix granuli]|uniref:TTHB210-like domain-containing protein n=1 Tax=Vecturithrix granuli TaxID=1499967 RepID=A0A081BVG9_VECG1|nr:hypothetical protein U27_03286 [Candidatus Vecturithrix granuli]